MDNASNDDNTLHEFDLSAWDAPAPPRGLADAVIAQLRASSGVPAIEPSERPKRWWIAAVAAGVLVASAATLAIIVTHGAHHAAASYGDVVATRPQRLDLDTVTADLDPGASIAWKRDRDGLVAHQSGTASWRVADDDKLRIETGAMVASIEATGASLRVEAHMNLSDARVIGASALTAAAVAFVTVVVYEGHVRVGSGGQTVTVEPGTTVELRPNQPPAPPDLVGANSDRVHELEQQLKQLQDENAKLHEQAVGGGAPASSDEVSCILNNYEGAACAKFKKPTTPCDAANLADKGRESMTVSAFAAALTHFEMSLKCKPDPRVEKLAFVAACQASNLSKATEYYSKLDAANQTTLVQICIRNKIDPRAASAGCDAQALADKGRDSVNIAAFGAALSYFEQSLACHDDPKLHALAYLAACQARNTTKARQYFAKLPAEKQTTVVQLCLRNGIDPRTTSFDFGASSTEASDDSRGYLQIYSKPAARISIDGKDSGMTTPITGRHLQVAPGKHKVTFTIGEDRYTYAITVEAGKTVTMSKDLQ